ncbi:FAD-dependent oxidoreductase [Rhodococcus aetherivorans]|uniref:FAD-dependent oxidoreductase n=1 Tax=Rhodococcus aetherivorans TaxID=191292 RepID=UPI001E3BD135|nr:monooxygenase [Rhodococcus aetherivorans]UGQ43567.1 monooxygenase [Rhodococcus aetherivorans]
MVIGAGMAGLLAARAVSESFDRVTVVERDTLPDTPTARRCVPQGRHAHTLTVRGKDVLEELFPGLTDILLEHSAPTGDLQADFRLVVDGHRFAKGVSGIRHMLVSRPLLEWQLRNSVQAIPNVEILDRCAVTTIATDPRTQAVTAVIVDSTAHRLTDHRIAADLAVDASGRSSQVQGWLESQGFPRPDEQRLSINLTYATRHYRREPSHLYGDLGLLVGASPALPRAGAILAQEHNSWIITLAGYGADAPSLDEEQFVEFAASLPAPEFADLLRHAEPLDTAVHYRIPTTVRRNFTAAHLPTGYVPFGDTLCCFNPVYGQGMSVAAVESLILRQCCAGDRGTLAGRFLRRIEPTLDEAWDMSANTDLRMPFIDGERTTKTKLTNAYLTRLYRAAATDARVGAAFLRVTNLLDHPAALMNPPDTRAGAVGQPTPPAGPRTDRPRGNGRHALPPPRRVVATFSSHTSPRSLPDPACRATRVTTFHQHPRRTNRKERSSNVADSHGRNISRYVIRRRACRGNNRSVGRFGELGTVQGLRSPPGTPPVFPARRTKQPGGSPVREGHARAHHLEPATSSRLASRKERSSCQ